MSRINTNVSSLLAQRILGQQNQSLTTSLERLSTGLRINRGADDPAGLIASENLRAEKTAITSAIGNAERANQVVNIAEGGLIEVSNLLTELESLVDSSANDAGLSQEEKEANQLQIDSILQTIDRIANSTSFQGSKLLNGTFDYTLTGVTTTEISEASVNAAKVPSTGTLGVAVEVVTSAQTGAAFLSAGGGAAINLGGGGTVTVEIAGAKGVSQFTFTSGAALTDAESAVNGFKEVTGVSASISSNILKLNSTSFGSDEFVSVKVVEGNNLIGVDANAYTAGTATAEGTTTKDTGRDATVNINGSSANVKGLTATLATANLDVELELTTAFNSDGNTSSFTITGGGANFQLSPTLDLAGQVSLGLPSVTTANLGSNLNGRLTALKSGGTANIVTGGIGNLNKAQNIIRDSIKQVSQLRGRLGAFQKNTIASTTRALGVALENTAAAESQVRDTDFAQETANLTRSQIQVQAATNVLAIANSRPQSVLALLG